MLVVITSLPTGTVAQDCNDLVTITSSGTDVLVNTSISRFCLQCVDGNMVFDPNNTIWEINRATVIDSTPGVDEVAGVLVLVDPMQLLMDGGVTLECSDIIEYNIQVFSSSEAHSTPLCEPDHYITPHSSSPPCGRTSCC